jgi:hypothetical protein
MRQVISGAIASAADEDCGRIGGEVMDQNLIDSWLIGSAEMRERIDNETG